MMGTTGSQRRTRTTPAMTTTRPPRRGRGQSINEGDDRKGRGGRGQQNGKSSLPALTPPLPARSSAFTPARSPVSTPAHPHTIPPCSYTRRPADPTCTPTRVDGHPSHGHPRHQHRWSRQPPHHQCRRPWQPPPAPTDDYGGYPQPQRLQLQWPPSASVATAPSPLPPSQFQRTDANSFSKFFFPIFLFFAPPAPVSRR